MSSLWVYAQTSRVLSSPPSQSPLVWWFVLGSPWVASIVQEAIKQLTKDQQRKIHERQCMISVTGVKKLGTKSTSSRGEGPSNLKGKGPDPHNWGALSACGNKLDLEAQCEALASWKAAQELVHSEQESKPDLSARNTESDTEVQRAAIVSWNEAHKIAKQESRSQKTSLWVPLSKESSMGTLSPVDTPRPLLPEVSEKPAKALSPAVEKPAKTRGRKTHQACEDKNKPTQRAPDPVRAIVKRTIAQEKSRFTQHKMPRAIELVEQVNPKSYIGLAFKCLGGKDK